MDKSGNLTSVDTYDSDFSLEEIEAESKRHFEWLKKEFGNPYDIFTKKQKRSLRFKISNLIVDIKCWYIRKFKIK